MKQEHFVAQMKRLINVFGKSHYPEERVQNIWTAVENSADQWFTKTVNFFIDEKRQAPLMPEFREELAKEREWLYQIEKASHKQDAKDFWEGTYPSDDISNICQTIRKIAQGQMKENETQTFIRLLESAANSDPSQKKNVSIAMTRGM